VTLHLRPNAVFHDGQPITADDIAFSLAAIRQVHPLKDAYDTVREVVVESPQKVVIRLSHPSPALLFAMTTPLFPVLPKHVYGDGRPLATHPRNTENLIGSGPYRLVELKPGELVVVEKFDRFFLPNAPRVGRIVHRGLKDEATALLALERGEIDYLFNVDIREIPRARRNTSITVQDNCMPAAGMLTWLSFNHKTPHLKDKRVRQAINYAIDKDFIVNSLFAGFHTRSTGPISSKTTDFYEPNVERYPFDLAKAASLLDEAGLKPNQNGIRMSLNVVYFPTFATFRPIVEYLRVALGKVGIDVRLKNAPDGGTWVKWVADYEFDLHVENVWTYGDPVYAINRPWTTAGIRPGVPFTNTSQYSNPVVDELAVAGARELDKGKRKEIYSKIQKLMVEDCAAAYLIELNWPAAWSKSLANPPTGMMGPISPWDAVELRR
jgi:peptide/nickel transport system substrate-binding protein